MNQQPHELRIEDRFKRLQTKITLIFTAIVIMVTVFLVSVILERSGTIIREKISTLTASNCKQLQLNISSYLNKVETTAALLFADESYYEYDATDPSLDEYTMLKAEQNIQDRIVDLGLMDNFADFGIVYANNHTVGWISRTTETMFSDIDMYATFSGCITDSMANDGWVFGLCDNMDRMFYVKRLNTNAILITSFYNRELASAFQYPQELQGMTVRLVNEENTILYSSQTSEIGDILPEAISSRIQDQSNVTLIDDSYLINSSACKNNWRVVCSIPTQVLLKENIALKNFAIIFAVVVCAAFILIGLMMIRTISKPMDGMVSSLADKAELDQLSGLLNKISFEMRITRRLMNPVPKRCVVLVMLDADHFKQVNDRLGHACGDQVIVRIGQLLKRLFDEKGLIGRIGGDEFTVFMEFYDHTEAEIHHILTSDLDNLMNAYAAEFAKEREACGLGLSAGICIMPDEEDMTFHQLYTQADNALYVSKRNGKNRYTFYGEDLNDETSL